MQRYVFKTLQSLTCSMTCSPLVIEQDILRVWKSLKNPSSGRCVIKQCKVCMVQTLIWKKVRMGLLFKNTGIFTSALLVLIFASFPLYLPTPVSLKFHFNQSFSQPRKRDSATIKKKQYHPNTVFPRY